MLAYQVCVVDWPVVFKLFFAAWIAYSSTVGLTLKSLNYSLKSSELLQDFKITKMRSFAWPEMEQMMPPR